MSADITSQDVIPQINYGSVADWTAAFTRFRVSARSGRCSHAPSARGTPPGASTSARALLGWARINSRLHRNVAGEPEPLQHQRYWCFRHGSVTIPTMPRDPNQMQGTATMIPENQTLMGGIIRHARPWKANTDTLGHERQVQTRLALEGKYRHAWPWMVNTDTLGHGRQVQTRIARTFPLWPRPCRLRRQTHPLPTEKHTPGCVSMPVSAVMVIHHVGACMCRIAAQETAMAVAHPNCTKPYPFPASGTSAPVLQATQHHARADAHKAAMPTLVLAALRAQRLNGLHSARGRGWRAHPRGSRTLPCTCPAWQQPGPSRGSLWWRSCRWTRCR